MPQPLGSLRQRSLSSADRAPQTVSPGDPVLRVLFVAQDPAIADLYRLKLELDGYQVDVVPLGGPVLQRALDLQPDLIFVDVRLPDREGMAMVHGVREDASLRAVPLVILTNTSAMSLQRAGLHLTGRDYVIRVVDLAAAS